MNSVHSIPIHVQALLQHTPVTQLLGQHIESFNVEAGTITVQYQALEQFLNPARQVQGGMVSAMLDDVTAVLVTATLEPGAFCATLSLNTSFLAAAQAGTITGKAWFESRGKNICNVRGELWQNGQRVATATAVCMVRRPAKQAATA